MAGGPRPEARTGALLVATPVIDDGNFERTVVYLIEHGPEGSVGVVLNRPTQVAVKDVLVEWAALASRPAVLFSGGPVSAGSVLGLARATAPLPSELFTVLTWPLGAIDVTTTPTMLNDRLGSVRLFSGYAGWGPGQLEGELGIGAWWVFDTVPDDLFDRDPTELWYRVLRRQGGPYRVYGFAPDDPSHN